MMLKFLILSLLICCCAGSYEADWESLDTRPLPQWYDDAKFGIFIHWGVYSVNGFGNAWFWINWKNNESDYVEYMRDNYPPNFTYANFAKDFTAEFYDPYEWAKLFNDSGAKYVVLTSKHHEGYTLWPSKYSFSWNSMDVGPQRDLVGELAEAIRSSTDLTFGLYHSLYEWFNPLYLDDKNNSFETTNFVDMKILPAMYELVNTYKPEIFWSDGEWEAPHTYWNATKFIAWLYNSSPVKDTVVTNDRWGITTRCKHGDFWTCPDRYNPGILVEHKWESCMTLDKKAWKWRSTAKLEDFLTTDEVISILVEVVSTGGNLLLNVGPTHDGRIPFIMQERLIETGKWLKVNGEAIYKTKPWTHQNDTLSGTTWYTQRNELKTVYAIALQWPEDNILELESMSGNFSSIDILGGPKDLTFEKGKTIKVNFPPFLEVKSQWAWVLRFNFAPTEENAKDEIQGM